MSTLLNVQLHVYLSHIPRLFPACRYVKCAHVGVSQVTRVCIPLVGKGSILVLSYLQGTVSPVPKAECVLCLQLLLTYMVYSYIFNAFRHRKALSYEVILIFNLEHCMTIINVREIGEAVA